MLCTPRPMIQRLNYKQADFSERFAALIALDASIDATVEQVVREILADVAERGDAAVMQYTQTFDRLSLSNATDLEIPILKCQQALQQLPDEQREALEFAAQRITDYAEHQKLTAWDYTDSLGNRLGQTVTALDRVGIYVPGGKAAYPSSVLMNALPAKVAGVGEIIMVVPTPDGHLNELVLAAAALAGVDRVFGIGGAQAVAALAYGTQSIPAVDKIVGPGNAYVAEAKRRVFGRVGIDMIAGPSEVLIIADSSAEPAKLAADMLAQAEHDERAQAVLISQEIDLLDAVEAQLELLLAQLPRADIMRTSLQARGALIQVPDLEAAVSLANQMAAEHLELALADAETWLPKIRHAGAIFIGHYSAEVLGDYCAGPNHVLPTSRSARFFSPLGVYDFQKRSSIIQCTPEGASRLASHAELLATGEGLYAHARSAAMRRLKKS